MSFSRFLVFLAGMLAVLAAFGVLILPFTFGDCGNATQCVLFKQRAGWLTIIASFLVYWIGVAGPLRRWSR